MQFTDKQCRLLLYSIPLLSLALHFHVFGMDLIGIHVWRQTETQTVINNFYSGDFNILNPRINNHADTSRIFRMEFPLMQWLFALFYKVFGPHLVISRVLTFIIGLFSVYGMYYLCYQVFRNKTIATLGAWCFNWSPVFYYYTVNPMPDNMALCCGIWSIGFFCRYLNSGKFGYTVLSAAFLGLATLTKLPFVLYGSFPFAWLLMQLWNRDQSSGPVWRVWLAYIVLIIPAAVWYAAVIPGWHNNGIVSGVFDLSYNAPDLWHVFTHTVVSTLPELLINYGAVLFFLAGIYFLFRKKPYRSPLFPCFLLWGASCILYFLFEMNMIDTVHDYYLFVFLPPIFLLVAYAAFLLIGSTNKGIRILSILCIAILPVTAFLRADSRWDKELPGFNPVYLQYKEQLRALIPKDALCVAGNDESGFILLYYIDRKGWTFDHGQLKSETLAYYISKGAKFLFSDSRLDEAPEIKEQISEEIFQKENLRVYRLK